jgi:hypothetical protein
MHYNPNQLFYLLLLGGGGTKSLGTAATSGLLYKPQMMRVIFGAKKNKPNLTTLNNRNNHVSKLKKTAHVAFLPTRPHLTTYVIITRTVTDHSYSADNYEVQ